MWKHRKNKKHLKAMIWGGTTVTAVATSQAPEAAAVVSSLYVSSPCFWSSWTARHDLSPVPAELKRDLNLVTSRVTGMLSYLAAYPPGC